MELTREQWDDLRDRLAANLAIDDADTDARADYSGRAMYGSRCIGFTIDSDAPAWLRLGAELTWCFDHVPSLKGVNVDGLVRSARWDSMGRDQVIVYFPGWTARTDCDTCPVCSAKPGEVGPEAVCVCDPAACETAKLISAVASGGPAVGTAMVDEAMDLITVRSGGALKRLGEGACPTCEVTVSGDPCMACGRTASE